MDNKENTEYQNYVVAFIDVLGQREAFKPVEGFEIIENKEELKNRLKKVHINTAYHIKKLREDFNEFFQKFSGDRPVSPNLPADKIKIFEEMRKVTLKFKSFSDCLQVFTSLKREKYHSQNIGSVYAMLMTCGFVFLLSLADKKVFRAGIDVGMGIEIDDNEIYGPALFRAYDLESKIAQYPRIVVGDTLKTYLLTLSNKIPQTQNQLEADIILCKSLADHCLKCLTTDIDGYIIFDYLGEECTNNIKEALKRKIPNNF